MKVLVIDNYDSFTYNLVHSFKELGCEVVVRFNDEVGLEEVQNHQKIVLSPGPGLPKNAGLLQTIVARFAKTKSILGICLGLQAIGEVFGGTLVNLPQVHHGVSTEIQLVNKNEILFKNIQEPIHVGRYHSWVLNPKTLPNQIQITAIDQANQIMAIRHKEYDLCAVQFHPESYLTPKGNQMLKNWLHS